MKRKTPTKEFIKQLREAIGDGEGTVAHDNWVIISSLRGPDIKSITVDSNCEDQHYVTEAPAREIKIATTAVIRHKLFPQAKGSSFLSHEDFPAAVILRKKLTTAGAWYGPGEHFIRHSRYAFSVLGLQWTSVNKDVEPEVQSWWRKVWQTIKGS